MRIFSTCATECVRVPRAGHGTRSIWPNSVAHGAQCATESWRGPPSMIDLRQIWPNSVAHPGWCATETQLSVAHGCGCAIEIWIFVAHQPRCATELRQICLRSIIEGGTRKDFVPHQAPCATESWFSVAWAHSLHVGPAHILWLMGKRYATESAKFWWRTCNHAPQNDNLPITLFLVVYGFGTYSSAWQDHTTTSMCCSALLCS